MELGIGGARAHAGGGAGRGERGHVVDDDVAGVVVEDEQAVVAFAHHHRLALGGDVELLGHAWCLGMHVIVDEHCQTSSGGGAQVVVADAEAFGIPCRRPLCAVVAFPFLFPVGAEGYAACQRVLVVVVTEFLTAACGEKEQCGCCGREFKLYFHRLAAPPFLFLLMSHSRHTSANLSLSGPK